MEGERRLGLKEARAKIEIYCNYRERCQQEVRDKLYSFGLTSDDVEQLISEMISCKLLNEERYAKSFCRGKFRYNQWGKNKITQALKFKKIGERNIKIGLKEIEEEEYFATILKLCERKLKEIKKKGLQTWQKNRLVSQSMIAKGFEMDLVLEAIKQIESNP